jgi:hypothetical protein
MDCFSGKEILYENYLDPDDAEVYRYVDYKLYSNEPPITEPPITALLGAGSN